MSLPLPMFQILFLDMPGNFKRPLISTLFSDIFGQTSILVSLLQYY